MPLQRDIISERIGLKEQALKKGRLFKRLQLRVDEQKGESHSSSESILERATDEKNTDALFDLKNQNFVRKTPPSEDEI